MDVSLQQMCRTCLSAGVALISLHANSGSSQTCTVAEMLGKFTTVMVSETDGLPGKVCLTCVSEIKRSYFFKIKCESSQDTLQQYVKELSEATEVRKESIPVKSEIVQNQNLQLDTRKLTDDVAITTLSNQEQISEVDDDNEYVEDETQGHSEDELLKEMPTISAVNIEVTENSTSYEINEYMGNSDSDDPLDRMVIIACEECMETFENKEDFAAHAVECRKKAEEKTNGKTTSSRSPKKCPECPMDFVHQKNLEKHYQKCHPPSTEEEFRKIENFKHSPQKTAEAIVVSNVDGKDEEEVNTSSTETIPEDAILKHDPAALPSGQYTCERCGAGFVNKKSLKCHIKINKCTVKQFVCKFCGKVFINDKSLIEHIKTHARTFKCAKCSKSFTSTEKLKVHTEKVHNGAVKNQCSFCAKVFTMHSTLKDHLRIHSGEKPFLCFLCGKGFSQNTNLKQHVMRHKNVKPFSCTECGCSFVSKGELNAHLRKHTGDHPFRCDVCNSTFTTSSSLVKHKRIHTGERPYACDFCPMRFAALGTLKNHRRTHTGEKPFQCEHCPRSFAQKSDCVTHMRSHTGERPYTCSVCGWGFPQSGTLKAHMRTHSKQQDQTNKIEAKIAPEEMDTIAFEDFI